jgi:hypothetical protein
MYYCLKNDKRKRFHIYIWRYTKKGKVKTAMCCNSCMKYLTKHNYSDKVFTFSNNKIISAISNNPLISIGNKLRHM